MNQAPLNSMGHVLILVIDVKHSPGSPQGPPYCKSIFAVQYHLKIIITIFGVIIAISGVIIAIFRAIQVATSQPFCCYDGCHS